MKLPNINEIAVSVIPTRTPVSKIHFSKEAAKSALAYDGYMEHHR